MYLAYHYIFILSFKETEAHQISLTALEGKQNWDLENIQGFLNSIFMVLFKNHISRTTTLPVYL